MHCIGFFVGVLFVTPAFPCIFNKDIVSGQFPACPQKNAHFKTIQSIFKISLTPQFPPAPNRIRTLKIFYISHSKKANSVRKHDDNAAVFRFTCERPPPT